MKELAGKLVAWIKEQGIKANTKGMVVGMSGGVDSSVVAVLCKQAFPNNMLGVLMPCHSNPIDTKHTYEVAHKFQISTKLVNLDKVFDALMETLPSGFSPETERIAVANLKPRLRMLTLYYFANRLGYLVVGCSNKSEVTMGYFTKYGDGAADILPLGNLVKYQVRELAQYLGIPQEIIDKPPSAGLWEGQTDEGEMGITYEELDRYITTHQASEEVKGKIETAIAANAHKRAIPPIPPF